MDLIKELFTALEEENYDKVGYLLKLDDNIVFALASDDCRMVFLGSLTNRFKALRAYVGKDMDKKWYEVGKLERITKFLEDEGFLVAI